MRNVTIYSDNIYAKTGLEELISKLPKEYDSDVSMAIYLLEKNSLYERELHSILDCQSDLILILSSKSIKKILSVFNLPKKIFVEEYNQKLHSIKIALSKFLALNKIQLTKINYSHKKKLSEKELVIILMYMQGITLHIISQRLNRNYKTIYQQKRTAMNKMGISTDIELIRAKGCILFANTFGLI